MAERSYRTVTAKPTAHEPIRAGDRAAPGEGTRLTPADRQIDTLLPENARCAMAGPMGVIFEIEGARRDLARHERSGGRPDRAFLAFRRSIANRNPL